jgi:hypothetical protein
MKDPEDADLFAAGNFAPASTPIAQELEAYFERGGSIEGAVQFVAALERAGRRAQPSRKQKQARGCRLPLNWSPARADFDFAMERGFTNERTLMEAEKFTNYWTAKSGTGAMKRDWSATWRNWILNAMERQHGFNCHPGAASAARRTGTTSDAVLAGMGRLAARLSQNDRTAIGKGREVLSEPSDLAPQLALKQLRKGSD